MLAENRDNLFTPRPQVAVRYFANDFDIRLLLRCAVVLCQIDDLRNETMHLSENFSEFVRSGVFQPSDMQKIRQEFYKVLSALLITDTEWDEAGG